MKRHWIEFTEKWTHGPMTYWVSFRINGVRSLIGMEQDRLQETPNPASMKRGSYNL